jgi:acetyl-CoA carboxylase biotin carboxyl carrier protein
MQDIKYVKKLISLFEKSSASVFEIAQGDFKLRLEKNRCVASAPILSEQVLPRPADNCADSDKTLDFNKLKEIKSPMVGVFYAAPAPGEKPFVERGSKIKKGDVLCIIESMKLMNEVTSDYDGVIADICVLDGQAVEYSQVLFKVY